MINVGIIGATGYTGEELISVLLKHPNVRITGVYSRSVHLRSYSEIFPAFKNRFELQCKTPDIKEIAKNTDLVFLALPHTASMEFVPKLLGLGKKVIDLSADYRLKDVKIYEKFYKAKHTDKLHLTEAVYGLPEIYRQKIKNAKLIANPGCYPTVSILALAPLIALYSESFDSIIIDAKSGVTGAGRKVTEGFLFSEVNEDFKAYKVNIHQHMPEINQELSKLAGKKINITFVPHLLPLNRGLLATVYLKKNSQSVTGQENLENLINLYKKFYKKEPFVRIKEEGDFPRIKDVAGTNFCDIGIKEGREYIIIIAVIDNLLKGAAGQAVQNMNIMYGLAESTALL
jgi:N-acetyl-gamma-glutamyl-phosphate reductase